MNRSRCYYERALYNTFTPMLTIPKSPRTRRATSSSFVSISEAFVAAVDKMTTTVLVPTKLMDIELGEETINVPQLLLAGGHSNLYEVFVMIKQFKERLASMALEDETGGSLNASDVDESLFASLGGAKAREMLLVKDLDSGNWSHSGSSASLEMSLGSDGQGTSSSEEGATSEDSMDRLSEASFRVKQGLSSAKGLCAFLIELTDLTDFIVGRYLKEMNCE